MKQTKSVLNGKDINLTGDNTIITSNNFNVDKKGNMSCNNATMNDVTINSGNISGGRLELIGGHQIKNFRYYLDESKDNRYMTYINGDTVQINHGDSSVLLSMYGNTGEPFIDVSVINVSSTLIRHDKIETPTLIQTSLEAQKKNFEKVQDNALEILKQIDIYKYNLKNEQNTDKKHIGFVIGDNYNYSKEVTSLDNKGVDNYAFTSLCCKAIQELSQKVEELENKLKEKEENNG